MIVDQEATPVHGINTTYTAMIVDQEATPVIRASSRKSPGGGGKNKNRFSKFFGGDDAFSNFNAQ